jgi:hypothetical protein
MIGTPISPLHPHRRSDALGVPRRGSRRALSHPIFRGTLEKKKVHRLAAALIAHAIKTARRIECPNNQEVRVSALRAIARLARPEAAGLWFDMAGFEYKVLIERLPLDRRIARARDLLASDAGLGEAVT